MNIRNPLWSLSLAGLAALTASPALAMWRAGAVATEEGPPTDRLIVRWRQATAARTLDEATLVAARTAGNRRGVQVAHLKPTAGGAHVLRLNRALPVSEVRALARDIQTADNRVEYAEPDRIMTIQLVPNDTSYASQWHYKASSAEPGGLNLPTAWDRSTGAGVVVAVIDTGYRPHVDLAANIVGGYDFIADTAVSADGDGRDASALDPGDAAAAGACYAGSPATTSSWHGTHVAGTIAALTQNGTGVAGVAFGAKVLPVRALGRCGGYTSDIAAGIVWASGGTVTGVPANPNPARVINLSLGGSGSCDTTTQAAINTARGRGTVVVVAAGNSNANASGFSPASCAGVVTVAAVGRTGGRASYSNYGSVVDVAAPGGDQSTGTTNGILSTLNTGTGGPGADSYAWYQGTSMATPHVAGVAALMLSKNSALTPDQVEALLKSSARAFPATCGSCGSGIVDATAAVNAAMGTSTPPPTPTPTPVTVNETTAANDSRQTAQTLATLPVTVNGSIASTTDTDYYALSLKAGTSLKVMLKAASSNADFDLYAYNSGGTQLTRSTLGTGATDTITVSNTGTTAQTIYLRVWRYSGTGAYTLGVGQ